MLLNIFVCRQLPRLSRPLVFCALPRSVLLFLLVPRVLRPSTGRNSPCAFPIFFFSLTPGTQKYNKVFFTSHTQIGRGFGNGPYKPSFDKPSHTRGRKREGYKNKCGELAGKTFPGVLLRHLVSLRVLFQYVAFSLVCETSFLVYVI